jgi:hypothetical protein
MYKREVSNFHRTRRLSQVPIHEVYLPLHMGGRRATRNTIQCAGSMQRVFNMYFSSNNSRLAQCLLSIGILDDEDRVSLSNRVMIFSKRSFMLLPQGGFRRHITGAMRAKDRLPSAAAKMIPYDVMPSFEVSWTSQAIFTHVLSIHGAQDTHAPTA